MRRFSILVYFLLLVQIASSVVAIIYLANIKVRTGWAQTYGAFSAAFVCIEALCAYFFRGFDVTSGRVGAVINDTLISITTAVASVGIIGLICNTEDGQHAEQGIINAVESAAMALTLAWGMVLVRLGGRYVEFAAVLEKENSIIYDARL